MKYFDTHAHYYDSRFEEEGKNAFELLDSLFESNVQCIINVGTAPSTCLAAIEQSKRYPRMYTALGIHPTDGQYLSAPEQALEDVENLILDSSSKCVAIGEIGLDYHYPDTDKEKQAFLFEKQMQLAEKLNLPVVIHDRDAHADVFDMILRHPNVRGILHSFSGSPEMAQDLVKRGYYISFSGTLTFTNARKVAECARLLPHDRVLIETDAPYLAPHPLRGTLNDSSNLRYTNEKLAEFWGISAEDCAKITAENAKRIFGL
jgi:TatD DNase family protein